MFYEGRGNPLGHGYICFICLIQNPCYQLMQDVTAAIIRQDDKVLIARRKDGRHAGKWEFPGGKVEPGEQPEDCLQRELQEEFGVVAAIGAFVAESVYEYDHGTIRLLAYEVDHVEGDMDPQDHDQIAWATPEDLLSYDLLPADIPLVQALKG